MIDLRLKGVNLPIHNIGAISKVSFAFLGKTRRNFRKPILS